jgi:esterase/lipase
LRIEMADELCILVHGFTGSPTEVEPLAEALAAEGYDVSVPILYGHAGTKEDMKRATTTQWINSVKPEVERGLQTHRRVHLIGFSMGALLCAILAAEKPVASLTMLAPAVYYVSTKNLFHQTANLIKATWGKNRGPGMQTIREKLDKMSLVPISSVRQFTRLVQLGKRVLPKLELPILIVQGELDDVVEPRGATFVYNTVSSKDKTVYYLPNSGHLLCLGAEAHVVQQHVLAFLTTRFSD